MFETLGAPELLIIGLLVVLLFGAGKVGKVGKELGTSVKEFRRAIRDEDDAPAAPLTATIETAPAIAASATSATPDSRPATPSIF